MGLRGFGRSHARRFRPFERGSFVLKKYILRDFSALGCSSPCFQCDAFELSAVRGGSSWAYLAHCKKVRFHDFMTLRGALMEKTLNFSCCCLTK